MVRLESLEIEGFRGIRSLALTLQPHKALLLHGLNGTGKSSLHQALTFAFTGKLLPVADNIQDQPSVVYRHIALDANTPASVKVTFSDGTNTYWVCRTINGDGSIGVRSSSPQALRVAEDSVNSLCFLTRRQFANMVDAVERDSWERLTPFLGHQEITQFREGLRALSNSIRRDLSIAELERRVERARQAAKNAENKVAEYLVQTGLDDCTLETIDGELARLVNPRPVIESLEEIDWAQLESMLPGTEKAKELARELQMLTAEQSAIRMSGANPSEFAAALDFCVRLNDDPNLAHDLVHAAFLQASSQVVRDLTDEVCPLCGLGQPDWEEIRSSLNQRLSTLATAQQELEQARTAVRVYSAAVADHHRRVTDWAKEHGARKELAVLSDRSSALLGLVEMVEERVSGSPPRGISMEEREAIIEAQKETRAAYKALTEAVEERKATVTAEQERLTSGAEFRRLLALRDLVGASLERLETETQLSLAQAEVAHSQTIVEIIQSLFNQVNEAEATLSADLLTGLETEVQRVFGILTSNPSLIPKIASRTERGVRMADILIEDFYGLGSVKARDYLSEANRNSLGLAIFFAGLSRRTPALEAVVVDDITHSADGVHRRGLAQYIANELAPNRQLIVLTHDDHWHSRLRATLEPGQWVEYQVVSWSLDGLTFRSEKWTSLLDKARDEIGRRELTGGNALRLAIEQFIDEACERYDVLVPFRTSPDSIKLNDKRQRLEKALRDAWSSGQGIIDPNQPAVRLISTSNRIANLASHYGSFDKWDYQDLLDALKDVEDVVNLFTCKHQYGQSTCGALLPRLTKQAGALPVCRRCGNPILL